MNVEIWFLKRLTTWQISYNFIFVNINSGFYAIITIPFDFEGRRKEAVAKNGLDELKKYIEKIDIVDGQNILVPENFKMTYYEALQKKASEVEKIFVKNEQ